MIPAHTNLELVLASWNEQRYALVMSAIVRHKSHDVLNCALNTEAPGKQISTQNVSHNAKSDYMFPTFLSRFASRLFHVLLHV